MKTVKLIFSFVFGLSVWNCSAAQTINEFIQKAEEQSQAGDIETAIRVMEEAIEKYPTDATAHAWLGGYLSQSAGQSDDMMFQATRSGKAFEHLDKAVALDSLNAYARFFRGIMGVMVPPFMGRLNQGITDLNGVLKIVKAHPETVSEGTVDKVYHYLGKGYLKKGQKDKARESWEEIIRRAPDSPMANEARSHLKELAQKKQVVEADKERETEDQRGDLDMARHSIEEGNPEKAVVLLKNIVATDTTDAVALAWLGLARAAMAGESYDERISEDTDFRTNAPLEGYTLLDKAVTMAPENPEIRLLRGLLGSELPAFMGKTEQAIDDLNKVIETSSSDSLTSLALYYLGLAYKRKGLSVWEDLITSYPQTEGTRMAFGAMKPLESEIEGSGLSGPTVTVRFAIGFETELEPQTAVWVEDEQGQFVKTLYVSGFSGHVGATQTALPKWAEASDFETDATTGASIAAGWHVYMWNVTDHDGNQVRDGTYTVNVEVHHWPSMQYQIASAPIEVGGREKVSRVNVGNLIPSLEVRYIP